MRSEQTILLVEDDQVDSMTIQRALRQLETPNPLHHVTDGEKALEFLRDPAKPRPGLILLDLNMPRMNGLEFLEHVKQDAELRKIPVVVLTTSREDGDRISSFERSVAGYMIKPVEYPQFVETMRKIRDYWTTSEMAPN
jgi:CheY-like chemotaxis protein